MVQSATPGNLRFASDPRDKFAPPPLVELEFEDPLENEHDSLDKRSRISAPLDTPSPRPLLDLIQLRSRSLTQLRAGSRFGEIDPIATDAEVSGPLRDKLRRFPFRWISFFLDCAATHLLAMSIKSDSAQLGKPNLFTFNALIKMHGNWGTFTEMMRVFEELRASGFSLDNVTLFGQNDMDSEVPGVFKEMKKAGYVHERDTYNTLISAYSRCGLFDQAIEIYNKLIDAGIGPDISTCNVVLTVLARGGLWEQAKKILAVMKNGWCKPSEDSYCSLLHVYANAKVVGRMHALAQDIYSRVIKPHKVLLKTLVLI